jgi:Uma2 family endonuclease
MSAKPIPLHLYSTTKMANSSHMAQPAPRLATYDDLLAAPQHMIAQLVNGELHLQPRPAGPHSVAASGLGIDLGTPFQRGRGGPGGWIILNKSEVHLAGDVVVPDLAAWRAERPPELEAICLTVTPVWVCEVISPSSGRFDRGPKADLYAKAGVEFMWLVEPDANLIEAFRLVEGAWLRLGAWAGEVSAHIPPFDAVALELGPLWVKKSQP